MKKGRRIGVVVAAFLGSVSIAHADAGVPMIFITLPLMLMALVPVVAIEAAILAWKLGLRYWPTAGWATLSNLVSTLVGIPLTWGVLVGIQLLTGGGYAYDEMNTMRGRLLAVTWQAPWLIPYERQLHWMIPAAMLGLLVPFFFASYGSEYLINRAVLKSNTAVSVRRATFLANLGSYFGLGLFVLAWLTGEILRKRS